MAPRPGAVEGRGAEDALAWRQQASSAHDPRGRGWAPDGCPGAAPTPQASGGLVPCAPRRWLTLLVQARAQVEGVVGEEALRGGSGWWVGVGGCQRQPERPAVCRQRAAAATHSSTDGCAEKRQAPPGTHLVVQRVGQQLGHGGAAHGPVQGGRRAAWAGGGAGGACGTWAAGAAPSQQCGGLRHQLWRQAACQGPVGRRQHGSAAEQWPGNYRTDLQLTCGG